MDGCAIGLTDLFSFLFLGAYKAGFRCRDYLLISRRLLMLVIDKSLKK